MHCDGAPVLSHLCRRQDWQGRKLFLSSERFGESDLDRGAKWLPCNFFFELVIVPPPKFCATSAPWVILGVHKGKTQNYFGRQKVSKTIS
jgi:hypothetical protein